MHVIVLGLSHKTAPIEIREKLAVPESRLGEALVRLCTYEGVREGLLLSTCNRVEVYSVVDDIDVGHERLLEFLADTNLSLSSEELTPHLYWYVGERAIAHLFRVAASLDSMVIGESQILGQLKDAFEVALAHKTTGVIMNKIVKKAISVAKRVRTETKIAEAAVSVSYAAVELAKKIFSNLNEKTVMLVGAGEMAKLAARHLIAQGVRQVRITTRTPQHAIDLAERFGGTPIPFDHFKEDMAAADIILVSTGASHYLIDAEDVQRAVAKRGNRPMFLIDISVPRNIEPAVRHVDNAFLFDIDDLQHRVQQNREERLREAEKAERMIGEEVAGTVEWIRSLEVTPTIVALRNRVDAMKQAEVERVLSRLSHLSPQDRELIEGLASAIVNKLIHRTMVTLKAEVNSANGPAFIEAARRFFSLDQSSPSGTTEEERLRSLSSKSRLSGHEEAESVVRKQVR
ncbi:MAG: glutamyl-tRNA reductase [Nitrospira sp.]|nr:glutamyl-tRNA reductase [Nitrospira sp.]